MENNSAGADAGKRRSGQNGEMASFGRKIKEWQVYLLLSLACVVAVTVQFRVLKGSALLKLWDSRVLGYLGASAVKSLRDPDGVPAFFRSNSELIRENAQLRQSLEQTRILLQQSYQRLAVVDRFARLHNFISPFRESGVYSQVVCMGLYYCDQAMTITGGWLNGYRVDDPVIGEGGLVGRIVRCGPAFSEVQLVTNAGFAAAGYLRTPGTQGIVKGSGKPVLHFDYVRSYEDIQPGNAVYTSGKDGVFPPNYPVGAVLEVSKGPSGFLHIVVAPFTDFQQVQHVFVILKR